MGMETAETLRRQLEQHSALADPRARRVPLGRQRGEIANELARASDGDSPLEATVARQNLDRASYTRKHDTAGSPAAKIHVPRGSSSARAIATTSPISWR